MSCNAHFYNAAHPAMLVVQDAKDSVVLETPVKGRFVVNTKYMAKGYKIMLVQDNAITKLK